MEKFHQQPKFENEVQRREEIQRLRQELADAMDHIEDEFSLQKISDLTAKLESLESFEDQYDERKLEEEFFRAYYPLAKEQRRLKRKQDIARRGSMRRKMKAVLVAAAVLLCLNGATMVIGGTNVFDALFNWNDETLQIGIDRSHESDSGKIDKNDIISSDGMTWQELEDSFGAEIPVIGYFIDEGMEITRMKQMRDDMVDIVYEEDGKTYIYTIQKLKYSNENRIIEKIGGNPTEFKIASFNYYFIQNSNAISIIWQFDNYVYTILGEINRVQAETIVQSIQYEEDLN